MNIKEIKANLTKDDIVYVLKHFNVHPVREDNGALVFPTVCHNAIEDQGSAKLFFYDNSKLFTCYTECASSFDIIQLIQNIYDLSYNKKITIFDSINIIESILNKNFSLSTYNQENTLETYDDISTFIKVEKAVEVLTYYSDTVLQIFHYSCVKRFFDFFDEPLSQNTLDTFEIGYHMNTNSLVFPWRDTEGRLVGLKGRKLDWTPESRTGKYMPLEIEGIRYKNKISLMNYGIYQNKTEIAKTKQVFLFEGEKSVLKLYDAGIKQGLAIGGQTIHPITIKNLLDLKVNEVILCFDKDYDIDDTKKKQQILQLTIKKAKQLTPFFNVSIMFDNMGLLNKKDSPIDNGIINFGELYKNKILL